MTSILDPLSLSECDDPAAVLAYARAMKQAEDDAAREVMIAAATWASMHSVESLVGPADGWHETCLPLGGEGCPEVAEFAVTEFAAVGKSTEAGRRYLAHAVEGCYRLPSCRARLRAGELAGWRLGFIAERTLCLSPAAAAFVDRHVAAVAHKIGRPSWTGSPRRPRPASTPSRPRTTGRLPLRPGASTSTWRTPASPGRSTSTASSTSPTRSTSKPSSQRAPNSSGCSGRRSPSACGVLAPWVTLARGQSVLDLDAEPHQRRRSRRRVVLHVHLERAAILGAGGLARLQEAAGPVTAEQVRGWCGNPDTQVSVRPVLDLAEHIQVEFYEASARLKNQADLRDLTCVFPFCTRRAHRCDHDHRVDHDDGGPTCSCNVAPACRGHHRAKTTGGWGYITVEPGVFLWRSPLGYQYLREATGTLDVTPDPERRRLARTFVAHFGQTRPEP
jgi:hypothetical protein